jgi:hypothetical protein
MIVFLNALDADASQFDPGDQMARRVYTISLLLAARAQASDMGSIPIGSPINPFV